MVSVVLAGQVITDSVLLVAIRWFRDLRRSEQVAAHGKRLSFARSRRTRAVEHPVQQVSSMSN